MTSMILADKQAVSLDALHPFIVVLGWVLALIMVLAQYRLAMFFARMYKAKHSGDFAQDSDGPSLVGIIAGQLVVLCAVPLAYAMLSS